MNARERIEEEMVAAQAEAKEAEGTPFAWVATQKAADYELLFALAQRVEQQEGGVFNLPWLRSVAALLEEADYQNPDGKELVARVKLDGGCAHDVDVTQYMETYIQEGPEVVRRLVEEEDPEGRITCYFVRLERPGEWSML